MNKQSPFKRFCAFTSILIVLIFSGLSGAQGNSEAAFERVREVQERNTGALIARDGIEGTGIGYDENGDLAIKVYTATAEVPGIPEKLEGVPVQAIVTGKFVARADPTARFNRPVPIGVSTGHPDITAGTIGCRVTDGSNMYALSNNHVYANANDASIGDEVIQPGPYDGGSLPNDFIGTLYDFEPLDFSGGENTIDAAIASSTTDLLGVATPNDGYGTPSSTTMTAYVGMSVKKYGRTTGYTFGTVDATNAIVDVCYECAGPFCFNCKKLARFVGQIIITPGTFSAGGDSGSLIVTDDSNQNPVGLLFAGSDTYTIANPIDAVLERFGVTIDDGSGGGEPTDSPPSVSVTSPAGGATVSGTAVTVSADASDDNGVAQVEFFVDSNLIATDTSAPYETSWDSTTVGDGPHTVAATATDTIGQTVSHAISVTVGNAPSAELSVTGIVPDTMQAGTSVDVTISGSGFAAGANVTLENGSGPTPSVTNIVVVDANTITATVAAKSGGPPRNRAWDVRVTNPDGSSGVLLGAFTVTP